MNSPIAQPTIPNNVIYYLPITFTNQNSIAVAANTQLAIGVNAANFNTDNVIGFNALAYSQYYTCNLNNAEFFFANGTVANSWLEGNTLNAQTANSGCTSASSQNALVDSSNILYWVLIPTNTFLPANTGIPTTNTIYLGWAGNALSAANTLLSNTITGEAPQLSGSYGQYDSGANVFPILYQNFAGTSTPAGWTASGSTLINNGVSIPVNTQGLITTTATYGLDPTQILDQYGYYVTLFGGESSLGYGAAANAYHPLVGWDGNADVAGTTQTFTSDAQSSFTFGNLVSVSANSVYTTYFPSTSFSSFLFNYANEGSIATTIPLSQEVVGMAMPFSLNPTITLTWVRIRTYPPNGILPGTSYGSPTKAYIAPTAPTLTLSNTLIDQGQSILFTAGVTNGNQLFSYNYLIMNSITNAIIVNQLYNNVQSNSNTFFWTPPANLYTSNTFQANVVIKEQGQYANTVNTLATAFGYNSAPIASISPSNILLDSGQYLTLSASGTTGGIQPYTFTFYNVTGTTTAITGCTSQSQNTCTFQTNSQFQANVFKYNVIVTDHATVPETVNSITNSITVNAIPIATISESSASINGGQTETFTLSTSNGVLPFTARLFNVTSGGYQIGLSNVLITTLGGTNTISIVAASGGTFTYNWIITDYGSTANYVFNSLQATIVVAPTSTIPQSSGGGGGGYCPNFPTCNYGGTPYLNGTTLTSTTTTSSTTSTSTTNSTASTSTIHSKTISTTAPTTTLSTSILVTTIPTTTIAQISKDINLSTQTEVVFNNTNTTVVISSQTPRGNATLTITNVTHTLNITPPAGLKKLVLLNLSLVTQNPFVSLRFTEGYPCNLPAEQIAPYQYANNTWSPISPFVVDNQSCSLSFTVTKSSLVGILYSIQPTPPKRQIIPIRDMETIILAIVIIIAALVVLDDLKGRRRLRKMLKQN